MVEHETRIDPDAWEEHVPLAGRPQIVVGGPGTGKTEFLCRRVIRAVEAGSLRPDEIIMLTFSRQGVADIRARLFDALATRSYLINVATYHSLAMRIVEAHASDLDWRAPPSVLAGSEQERFVASLLNDEDPAKWPAALRPILTTDAMAGEITDFILRCHEHLMEPRDVAAHNRALWRALPTFFERYLAQQVTDGRTDYGRVLADAVRAVETWPEVAAPYSLIVADEYQDTSPAHSRLLLALAGTSDDLVVAADPYQSIYSFRGTDLHNVFSFPDDTERTLGRRAERLILTTSFRVPANILSAAVALTARELRGGAGKVLSTRAGGTVLAHTFAGPIEEADWIASDIERVHLADGVPLERIAVFLRSGTIFAHELARSLERRDLAHTSQESRLADEPIVRFVRDLVTAAGGDDQADAALRRVLQSPYVGVPVGAVAAMEARHSSGDSWAEIIASSVPHGGPLAALLADPNWATQWPAPDGLWHLWSTLPQITPIATTDTGLRDRRAWSAFAQALERLTERAEHATLSDHEELVRHADYEAEPLFEFRVQEDRGVTISTLHRSKGTEFDVVYIANAVEGVLPDLRTTDSLLGSRHLNPHVPAGSGPYRAFRLDEERRLAYTAMTRATAKVVWSATAAPPSTNGPQPSRFLPLVAPLTEPGEDSAPLTPRSFVAALRRELDDAQAPPVDRLAAASVLAAGPELGFGEPLERYGQRQVGSDRELLSSALRMSPSRATSYLECPRKYAIERYLLTRTEESVPMRFGSLIHQILEDAEQEAIDAGSERATLDDALRWLDAHWDELGFGEDAVGRAWHRKATGLLDDMYRLWPSKARPIGLETVLELMIEGTPWLGRADRIEVTGSKISVVDYKTSTSPATKKEAAESIQLGYYALAAAQHPSIVEHGTVSGAEFWYPRITNKASIATRSFEMGNLDGVRDTMVSVADSIRNEEFDPTVNAHCSRCEVEQVCPARPAGQEAFAK